jgi:cytochrome c
VIEVKQRRLAEVRASLAAAGVGLLLAGSAATAAPASPKGDATHGQQLFARCAACHTVGQGAGGRMGPTLNGVVGRQAGSLPNYPYSAAMKNSRLKWDAPTLAHFLQGPMKAVPGTKMAFPGLADSKDQADIIAYLQQYRADGSKK